MSIQTELRDGILRIGINRPEKKNAFTGDMYASMAQGLQRAEDDSAVRVVLFHGRPEIFAAGNDIDDFLNNPPSDDSAPVFAFLNNIARATKPLIAAVNGAAIGVGTTMLLHCDLVYVADNARFGLPFVPLGIIPEAASSLLMPLTAGYQGAAEKLLLGEPFNAEEALRMGFVTRILPAADVLAHAEAQAAKLVALPGKSVRATKRLMKSGAQDAVMRRMAEENALLKTMINAPEATEAFQAFLQKRKPDFSRFN